MEIETVSSSVKPDEAVRLAGMDKLTWKENQVSQFRVVDYKGQRIKVRAYKDPLYASRQLELLQPVQALFAPTYGRVDNCLIMDYIDNNDGATEPFFFRQIGLYLGTLSNIRRAYHPPSDLEAWLECVKQAHLFKSITLKALENYYLQCLFASQIAWTLEYFDARPANFIRRRSDEIISIDEKHLRVGPRGISLVKPKRVLSSKDYKLLENAYYEHTGFRPFEDSNYSDFLHFYWHLYALAHRIQTTPFQKTLFTKSVYGLRVNILKSANVPAWLRMLEEAPWKFRLTTEWGAAHIKHVVKSLLSLVKSG